MDSGWAADSTPSLLGPRASAQAAQETAAAGAGPAGAKSRLQFPQLGQPWVGQRRRPMAHSAVQASQPGDLAACGSSFPDSWICISPSAHRVAGYHREHGCFKEISKELADARS